MYRIKYILICLFSVCCFQLFSQVEDSVSRAILGSLYETWDSAFTYNNWSRECSNWQINYSEGNPAPCATFSSDTNMINYSCALISDDITYGTGGYVGLKTRFQFDYLLKDLTASNTEFIILNLYCSTCLCFSDTISNNGSTEWIHYDKFFNDESSGYYSLEFEAYGQSSNNFAEWLIDNVQFDACSPLPQNISASAGITINYDLVSLDWNIPIVPSWGDYCNYHDRTFENCFASTYGGYGLAQLFRIEDFFVNLLIR